MFDDARRCAICGLPEAHGVHDRNKLETRCWVELVDVTDVPESHVIGAQSIPLHGFIDDSVGLPSDGHTPKQGALRWPKWRVLDELFGVPLLEGYLFGVDKLEPSTIDVHEFIWREPRSHRWRWGCYTPKSVMFDLRSHRWLHEAIHDVHEMAKGMPR